MNDTRREQLIAQYAQMALFCVRVPVLARFYIGKAKALIPPPDRTDLLAGAVPSPWGNPARPGGA